MFCFHPYYGGWGHPAEKAESTSSPVNGETHCEVVYIHKTIDRIPFSFKTIGSYLAVWSGPDCLAGEAGIQGCPQEANANEKTRTD